MPKNLCFKQWQRELRTIKHGKSLPHDSTVLEKIFPKFRKHFMARTARSKNKFSTNIFCYDILTKHGWNVLKIYRGKKEWSWILYKNVRLTSFSSFLIFLDGMNFKCSMTCFKKNSIMVFVKHSLNIKIQLINLLFKPMLRLFYLIRPGLVDLTPPVWVNQMIPKHGRRGGGT
mgnify:CR=1 FL=1